MLQPKSLWASPRPVAPSDTVRFAAIGNGVRGCELLHASLRVPGAECVAVCDLYDSRHLSAQQALNKSVPATRDYRAILDRKDVDAVIIAVPDHQHRRVFVDACAAGKDVYCEKPMSHTVEDGFAMVEAAQKANRIVQIGSQRVSSILYARAKEIYDSGKLGEVYAIRGLIGTGILPAEPLSAPFLRMPTNRPLTGTPFSMAHPNGRLTLFDFSAGAVLLITDPD